MDTRLCNSTASLLALSALLTVSAQRAVAQDDGRLIMEEVIVVAPRLVKRETLGRTATGADVERITLTRRVSYSDLDLTRHADVLELESRVSNMAETACAQLADLFPLDTDDPQNADCVRHAKASALAQVDAAAKAAE